MKLKDQFGACGYYWYGAGGHQPIGKQPLSIQGTDIVNADGNWVSTVRAMKNFKLFRAFVDNWAVVPETVSNNQTFTLKTRPTEQNFYFDDFFMLLKENGITNIWSASGMFDWYKPLIGDKSQRKSACADPNYAQTDPRAWLDLAHLCKLIAERYKDTGLVDYIQVLNEWDFRWNIHDLVTPEEYAVCFKLCYEAIRSVSPNQAIMTGCTLTPDMATAQRFITAFDALYTAEGKAPPRDFTYTFNNYVRTESNNQGNGIGATVEETNRYENFFKPLNDYCEQIGLDGFACTEAGWNTSPSTSVSAMKSKAPTLEGFNIEQAQGVLTIRMAIILASLPKCKGVTFYHCKDGYEAEPFTYIGYNYDKDFGGKIDWSEKPANTMIGEFNAKYGEYDVLSFKKEGNKYYAYLANGDDRKILGWSDKVNVDNLSPMPLEVTEVPPQQSMLTIQNNRLQFNGQPFKIIEANSPESRLKYLDTTELDYLHSVGVNTIYFTAFGGDVTDIHPFIDRSNPSLGFDEAKLAEWKAYAEYWVNKGGTKVLHILLSEKENHYELSDADHFALIDKLVATFGHLPVIWDREELDNGKTDYINKFYGYLKTKHPQGIRGIHNNTNQNPWSSHYDSNLIQFLSFQENISSFDSRIKGEVTKNPGWAGYASEMTGGFTPTDTTKVDTICSAGGELSSGAGFYIASKDLGAPGFQQQYEAIYKRAVSNFTGVVTPPTTNMQIGYSTKADRSDFIEFPQGSDTPFKAGSYYVEARSVTAPVVFTLKKDGVVVKTQTENGAPYDLVGGSTFAFTQGSYELTVKDKVGQGVVTFTVGTVVPPQPVTSPIVKSEMLANGTIEFTAQDGRKKVV